MASDVPQGVPRIMRLIEHLKGLGLSNRQARDAMASGKVAVAGIPTRDGGRTVEVSKVTYRPNAPRVTVGRDLLIIWRDKHMAVVYKPSGMLSVPAPRRRETNVLAEAGKALGSCYAVHRLDEGTSGLMMVARSERCQMEIKSLLEAHRIERRYLALIKGKLPKTPWRIESSFVRNRGDGKRGSMEDAEGGRRACTHFQSLERLGRYTLVGAQLETGRTHQVRIHLAEAGCPVLGDRLYGGHSVARLAPRLALHATLLALRHPITGESLRFEAPLADDLETMRREVLARITPPKRDA